MNKTASHFLLYFFYISLLEFSGGINRALHQSAVAGSLTATTATTGTHRPAAGVKPRRFASGGNLASIANRQTDAFLKAKGNEDFWIGGTNQGVEGKWRWTDGSSWVFTHWASGEPSGASRWLGLAIGKKEDCLMMDFSKGAWNDDACSVLQLPSFCSQPICFGKFS